MDATQRPAHSQSINRKPNIPFTHFRQHATNILFVRLLDTNTHTHTQHNTLEYEIDFPRTFAHANKRTHTGTHEKSRISIVGRSETEIVPVLRSGMRESEIVIRCHVGGGSGLGKTTH